MYKFLIQIMVSSHLDSERMLRMLPAAALLEIRALLLERTGRHDEILRYITSLRNAVSSTSLSFSPLGGTSYQLHP